VKRRVTIETDNVSDGVNQLLFAMEPDDVPRLARSVRNLSGFRALLLQLFAPDEPAADRTPIDAAELNEVEDHLRKLEDRFDAQAELLDRMADEIAGLHRLALGQAERIAAQSEMLARRAEAAAVPAAGAERMTAGVQVTDGAAADLAPTEEPAPAEPAPQPSANGHPKAAAARLRRLEVARFLAAQGPHRTAQICAALDIPRGSITYLLGHEWFAKTGAGRDDPYGLTDAGRAALAGAGYVLVPPAAAAPPEPAAAPPAEAPRPAPNPGAFALKETDRAKRCREQARAIAEAIAASGSAPTADEIARESGLPPELVAKRLRHYGPDAFSQSATRYFLRIGDAWALTEPGRMLAAEGAPV
jgi:hypothetical protein